MSEEESVDVELPATLASAGAARAVVRRLLDGWPTAVVDDAQLLVSELVTNAVLHAHTGVAVSLRRRAGVLRVEVADGSLDRPRPRRPADDAETGRGLLLVDALSRAWGAELREGGKVVWFEVARSGAPDDGASAAVDDDGPVRPDGATRPRPAPDRDRDRDRDGDRGAST